MGQFQPKPDEHDELMPGIETESESVLTSAEPEPHGVADGEELVLAQVEELSDEAGLDVETGVEGGVDVTALVDADDPDDGSEEGRTDAAFEDAALIDAAGEEDGWTDGSEGDADLYHADFGDDEPGAADEDGGVDGTDDPLHDGIDEHALPPLLGHDADDTLVDEIEQDLLREIAHEA